uniref:Sec-independent protein translocase protein TATBic n=1 Tax=Rhizophora mucronata TaxID=61149 RepID=A0A2P2JEV4_RHIMU
MATLISASTATSARSALLSLSSSSSIPFHKTAGIGLSKWIPQLGLASLSHWSGLKRLGLSITPKDLKTTERRGRCKGKVVQASLFGVGAPEALVIGVVALLVFGPKGLAEVARNLGKTLRAFQPTIRELQEVSREFKNTLEREIGLDEMSSQKQNTYGSNTASTTSTSNTSTASNENSPPAAEPSE